MTAAAGGRLPEGLRRGRRGDSVPVTLSEGLVLCEGCGTVCEGGTEKDRFLWLLNHGCRLRRGDHEG